MPTERVLKDQENGQTRSKSKKNDKQIDTYHDPRPRKSNSKNRPDEHEVDKERKKHRSSKNYDYEEGGDNKKRSFEKKNEDEDVTFLKNVSKSNRNYQNDDSEYKKSKKKEILDEDVKEKSHRSKSYINEEFDVIEEKPRKSHKSYKIRNNSEDENDEDSNVQRKDHKRKEKVEHNSRSLEKKDEDIEDHRERLERSKHRYESSRIKTATVGNKQDEYEYDEDFDDDWEEDGSDKEKDVKAVDRKTSPESFDSARYSSGNSDSRVKYYNEEYEDYKRGRVMKANVHVQVPTELVEIYSSRIAFNHDSLDRQCRRAKDLKKTIELDVKILNLLDINPDDMRTVYSSHLKHEKVQTNDDVIEIEIQTEEIDFTTRWTQYPPEDIKGFGTENNSKLADASFFEEDLFNKFRLETNFLELQNFLMRASKVIEIILKENNDDYEGLAVQHKSPYDFSKGFTTFTLPKSLNKITKNALLTNCTFCQDDVNLIMCTYDVHSAPDRVTSSILVVWNSKDPQQPFKVLVCESKSNCVAFTSFMVFSGNLDGSIAVWDLREPFTLHLSNMKKKEFRTEETVIRSATYSTAGVTFNENHLSEVKAILPLQNKAKDYEKSVFLQLASLELESKLIIWTVVELNNVDLAGFETDLGLLPGGRIKLVKTYQINLDQLITPFGKDRYQTFGLAAPYNITNTFFINTNMGRIIRILRESETKSLTTFKSQFDDANAQVTTLQFHHELQDILLAGFGNGELRLYHVNYTLPIKTWHFSCQKNEIAKIHWIPSKSSSFLVIDILDNIYIWNLLEDDTGPIFSKKLEDLGGFAVSQHKHKCNDIERTLIADQEPNKASFATFNLNSKELQVHLFSSQFAKRNDKESKKFAKFIKNILLTF